MARTTVPTSELTGTRRLLLRRAALGAATGVIATVLAVAASVGHAPSAAAVSAQPLGIDIANYQHPNGAPINWPQVKAAGVEYAFVKATEGPVNCTGSHYTNGYFKKDFADVATHGMFRGAYHFARPGDTDAALTQARYFASVVGPIRSTLDLPPVLDLEVTCGLGPSELINFTRVWIDEVTRLTGRRPMIYTGFYFWKDHMANTTAFAGHPLWVATYGPAPMVPAPWRNWTFWQYSSSGQIPGIVGNVDVNRFAFGSDGLTRLVGDEPLGPGPHDPVGVLDTMTAGRGYVDVAGWAFDPGSPKTTSNVTVYVNGAAKVTFPANRSRPDVGSVFPQAGANHGFSGRVGGLHPGPHVVCVDAVNIGLGRDNPLGCRNVTVTDPSPQGTLDVAAAAFGSVRVTGWVFDPDTSKPVNVHVYVGDRVVAHGPADRYRPDVAAAYKVGTHHGFDFTATGVPSGRHRVCVYGLNAAGEGSNSLVGCSDIDLAGGSPRGGIDSVASLPGGVRVKGWALDPDLPGAIPVHVYVAGAGRAVTADVAHSGVAQLFPAWGPNHGFDVTFTGLAAGTHQLCAYGINAAGTGGNVALGCRDVAVLSGAPISHLGSAEAVPGGLRVTGWALDPDTASSVPVHVYVDGVGVARTADRTANVGVLAATYGQNHGFDVTFTGLAAGDRTVCAYAIDVVAPGGNTLIGCRTLRVSAGSPIGAVTEVTPAPGSVRVGGWAIDPDTVSSVPVHIYVDGVGLARTANVANPVIGMFFPAYGPNHAFDVTVAGLRPGRHELCAYGIDVAGMGGNALLGCQVFVTP